MNSFFFDRVFILSLYIRWNCFFKKLRFLIKCIIFGVRNLFLNTFLLVLFIPEIIWGKKSKYLFILLCVKNLYIFIFKYFKFDSAMLFFTSLVELEYKIIFFFLEN